MVADKKILYIFQQINYILSWNIIRKLEYSVHQSILVYKGPVIA